MVGWSPRIVVVIDTFRPKSGWTDPIIKVVRPGFSMTEPYNCICH
jgi:hypothetical protein